MRRAALVVAVTGLTAAAALFVYGSTRARGAPTQGMADALGRQIALRTREAGEPAHRRAIEISALTRLRAVVSTDAATVRDLTSDEISLQPTANETIEIGQIPKQGRPVSLLLLPEGARAVAPLDRFGAHLVFMSGQLLVSDVVEIQPLDRANEVTGVVAVSLPVDLKSISSAVDALGWQGRLLLPEASVPLTALTRGGAGPSIDVALQGELLNGAHLVVQAAAPVSGELPQGLAAVVAAASIVAGAVLQWRGRPRAIPVPPEETRRYRLVRNLARGGMGEVWEAVSLGSNGFERKVAIKRVLPDRTSDRRYIRMFVDEARIASKLHHANIAAVLDFGVADGVPFQVLEFVEGVDLRELWKLSKREGRPIPLMLALHICVQIAHALQYAHEARDAAGQPLHIVHRDVTPGNILISWEGDIKLSDFGIALAEGRLEKTASGVAKGKLGYMAPEQAIGGTIDARTDVFSLGCVLHALVAGAAPFSADDTFQRFLSGEDLPLNPMVPDAVRPIIEKAIRRSRFERYASARAMAEAMGAALAPRLARDPRLIMREWLDPFRPTIERPPEEQPDTEPPGRELVLSSDADAVPVFVTHPTAFDKGPSA